MEPIITIVLKIVGTIAAAFIANLAREYSKTEKTIGKRQEYALTQQQLIDATAAAVADVYQTYVKDIKRGGHKLNDEQKDDAKKRAVTKAQKILERTHGDFMPDNIVKPLIEAQVMHMKKEE